MQSVNSPRKPIIALLMALILPGFGQLYNGEVNKAIWWFLSFAFLSIPGMALIALYLPTGWMLFALIAGLILTLSIWIYGIVDAWRTATKLQGYRLQYWQVSGSYALVLIFFNFLFMPLMIDYVRQNQVESFSIPSQSMVPGVLQGDVIFTDKRYNCPGCKNNVNRGDIAIFVYPNDRSTYYIKRIIGLPGDNVQVKGRSIMVNGDLLTKSENSTPQGLQVVESEGDRQWSVQWSSKEISTQEENITVPPGEVFVLGDNRDATKDSRVFGTVPLQDVVGLARQVWFSMGDEGVRWGRLGTVLE